MYKILATIFTLTSFLNLNAQHGNFKDSISYCASLNPLQSKNCYLAASDKAGLNRFKPNIIDEDDREIGPMKEIFLGISRPGEREARSFRE